MEEQGEPSVRDRYDQAQIRWYYASGLWRRESLFDEVSERADRHPGRRFVFDSSTSLSYGELREQGLRVAVGLHRLGVRPGDKVVVQLPNWTEFPVVALALARLGAVVVPVMPIYRHSEVDYIVRHSGAAVAVTAGEFRGFDHLAMFRELRDTRLRAVVTVRPDLSRSAGTTTLGDLMARGSLDVLEREIEGLDGDPDNGFLIVYTSGTTSRPKGCYHTLNTIRSTALAMARAFRYTADDVQFGPSPITHGSGLVHSILLPLLSGASSHLMEIWDPADALDRIDAHRCTAGAGATTFMQMMLAAYDPARHDLSSLRYWACAGSPIAGAVIERARTVFPSCRCLSVYGRTENFLTTMCGVDDPPERSVASDGTALHGSNVAILGPDGVEVPRGVEGDIAYRGPSHMLAYYRDRARTAALFTESGLSRSGDLGRMDEDGYVRVTGRSSDIVVRGGMNISAQELEDHLAGHPLLAAVAVVGMPDERLGEKVCVYVVPKDPATTVTLADITYFLRGCRVATQKLPERVEVVTALPMTPTGKVQKHLLRGDIREKVAVG